MSREIRARLRIERRDFKLEVELTLPGRGVTGLFGHSGSGKTTCLRAIAGLERAADGYFAVGDEVWQDEARGLFVPPHQRALGMVFQEASLFPHLSVRGNMQFGEQRTPASKRHFALSEVAELLGIEHLLDRSPGQLSGGERQRVAIARALLAAPQILLLDEPLAGVGEKEIGQTMEVIVRAARGRTVLLIEHNIDVVMRVSRRVVVLHQGAVLAAGTPDEVRANPAVREAYLGDEYDASA